MIRYDELPPVPGPGDTGNSASEAADGRREALPIDYEHSGPAAAADLDAASRQRDEYYDLLLRKTAEFDNYRKRVERERRELSEYTAGEFAKELLPVLDDFARALHAEEHRSQPFRQGVELIYRRLLDALAKRGITPIEPIGELFDPYQHEAVARVPAEGRRDGEIVEVFSPGYKIGDRLLRPAMVKVATA
jgi:molecular chaperone GrpE